MLTKEQKIILEEIFNSDLKKTAAWGGGTALSEIYLHHRKSEDVDIILSELPEELFLTTLTNQIAKKINAQKKKNIVSMNRFQYVFELKNGRQQKLEFIYYPFPKLAEPKKIKNIKIESLLDIAVSKTLSAYQREEVKDAFDLFVILQEKKFELSELIQGVEEKFGETIDPATLLARLTKTLANFDSLKPMIIREYPEDEILALFQKEFDKFLKKNKY